MTDPTRPPRLSLLLTRAEVLGWLRERDPAGLEALRDAADTVRRREVGDEVHLRGLVEASNTCVRQCACCGLRAGNHELVRYRMEAREVLDCARRAVELGYGTLVVQAAGDRTVVSGAQARKGWRRTGVCSLQLRIRRRGP